MTRSRPGRHPLASVASATSAAPKVLGIGGGAKGGTKTDAP